MLTTALFVAAAAIGLQNQPGAQEPLSPFALTGQPIQQPFPTIEMPRRQIKADGLAFEVTSESTLGAFLPDPAASDVWTALREPTDSPNMAKPLKVKLVLFSDVLMLHKGQHGWIQKRSALYGPDREQLSRALVQFQQLIHRSGLLADIDFSEDNDTIFVRNDGPAIPRLYPEIQSILEPRINDDSFQGEDPQYRGPFDVVIALHAGLTNLVETGTVGRSELTLVPALTATSQTLDTDLAATIYAAAQTQLQHRRYRPHHVESAWAIPFGARALTPSYDPTVAAPVPLQGRQPADVVEPLPEDHPLQRLPLDTTFAAITEQDQTLVAGTGLGVMLMNQLTAPLSGTTTASDSFGRIWVVGMVKGSYNVATILGQSMPARTDQDVPKIPEAGVLPITLAPYGSYFYDVVNEQRSVAPIQAVFRTAGGIRLIGRRASPVIADPHGKFLTVRLKLKSPDIHSLNFFGQDEQYLGSVQISGEKSSDPRVTQHRVELTGETQTVTIPIEQLSQPIYAIDFGTTPDGILNSRLVRDPALNVIESLILSSEGPATPDTAPAFDSFQPPSDLKALFALQTNGGFRELSASAGAIAELAGPADVEKLGEMSRSGREVSAYFASQALARIGTPAAQEQLLQTIKEGPFEWNRRCAAMAVNFDVPNHWLDYINFLTSSRSWQVRLAAVKLFPRNSTPPAQIFLVSSIQDPVSNVRWQVAHGLDPKSNLSARRLLFLAVNDSSEDVRAECYRQLLASNDAAVVDEAMRGIRDESRLVKMTIIDKIRSEPDERYRDALRIGMLERNPEIQAAILQTLALLPEPTNFGEVSTAAGSNDERVQLALLKLAESKGVVLPAAELERLAGSPNQEVARLARKLQGGL